jgi:hypothetical protein
MTDQLFSTTAEIEKARALWEKNVLVAERSDEFHKLKLYQLRDAYLEVTWHIHFNVVIKASRFTDTNRLEPYLEEISLQGLL